MQVPSFIYCEYRDNELVSGSGYMKNAVVLGRISDSAVLINIKCI